MVTLQGDVDQITRQDVADSAAGDLIPTGTYEGQIVDVKVKTVDKAGSPYEGTDMARVTVDLFDVGGRTRKHFVSLSDRRRFTDAGRLMGPSDLYGKLVDALTTLGAITNGAVPPLTEGIALAGAYRFRFRVRLAPAKGIYDAGNWTDAITVSR
jgi:hypothetical protein